MAAVKRETVVDGVVRSFAGAEQDRRRAPDRCLQADEYLLPFPIRRRIPTCCINSVARV